VRPIKEECQWHFSRPNELAMGEPESGECPVGEPEKDNSPVGCCPGERPSHGWLGPVPKRSRECEAQGSSRRTPKRSRECVAKGVSRRTPKPRKAWAGTQAKQGPRSAGAQRRKASPPPARGARLRSAAGFHGVSQKQMLNRCLYRSPFDKPPRVNGSQEAMAVFVGQRSILPLLAWGSCKQRK
jgi:hypothetical protein